MLFFKKRQREIIVDRVLRRVTDLTSPNLPKVDESRVNIRYNRSLYVAICPAFTAKHQNVSMVYGVTTDLCDEGIGIVTTKELDPSEDQIWLGILKDGRFSEENLFFEGTIVQRHPCRFGLYHYGIFLSDFMAESNPKIVEVLNLIVENDAANNGPR